MIEDHQPGQAAFRSILPEEVDWKPFPAFPPPTAGFRGRYRYTYSSSVSHDVEGCLI
jgi:hypothetical protein